MKDILLDSTNDLLILNGDFAVGESEMQEVGLILETMQGEWKENPVIGANLFQFMRSKADINAITARVKLHLELDDKEYADIKEKIQTRIKTQR
jgi:hypothetical protein